MASVLGPDAPVTFTLPVFLSAAGQPVETYTLYVLSLSTIEPNTVVGQILSAAPSELIQSRSIVITTGATTQFTTAPASKTSSNPSQTSQPSNTFPNNVVPPTGTTSQTTNLSTTNTASSTASGAESTAAASSGTNAGLVAGVAIACIVAGLLLGFALAFLWFRRRAHKNGDGAGAPATLAAEGKEYGTPSPPLPPTAADKSQLAKFLLDSSPDKDIVSELRSLGTLIQQHVENNYVVGPVQVESRTLAMSLAQLGIDNNGSLSLDAIAQLAQDPSSRHVAIQHVISQVVFTSVDVGAKSRLSMLPAPIAAFLQSIPPRENGGNQGVASYALNQWRVLSAFLLHPARSQRTPLPPSNAAVAPQAAGLVEALSTFLGYFVARDERSMLQQQRHLQDVITECAKLGYVLLSQPSEWRFVHVPTQPTAGPVAVVCAGLAKVTSKDGTPYPTPQQAIAPSAVPVRL